MALPEVVSPQEVDFFHSTGAQITFVSPAPCLRRIKA